MVFRPATYQLRGKLHSQEKEHRNTRASVCDNDFLNSYQKASIAIYTSNHTLMEGENTNIFEVVDHKT